MVTFGTSDLFSTLGSTRAAEDTMISRYDPATLYRIIQAYVDAHNDLWSMMAGDLLEMTMKKMDTWGGYDSASMTEGDEYSRPDAQKVTVNPVELGYPLRKKQWLWQVTRLFMETKSLGDLERTIKAGIDADRRDLLKSLRKVVFNPTNNLNYIDINDDSYPLKLRAFTNADNTVIPPGLYGTTFDPATHTHFLAAASPANADVLNVINTVKEHYDSGEMRLYINAGDEDDLTAFTGFKGYVDPRITPSITSDQVLTHRLDLFNTYNRRIGIFGSAEVWVKPWIPAGYMFAFNSAAPKPLRMRIRNERLGALRIAAEYDIYPLFAQFLEREYGIGVRERTNGAVLYTGGGSYVAPSDWNI